VLVINDHGDDSYLEVTVKATDSLGATTTELVRVEPRYRNLQVASQPPGVPITVNSANTLSQPSFKLVAGSQNSISAPATYQDLVFVRWSDGAPRDRSFTMPDSDAGLTAYYGVGPAASGPTGSGFASLSPARVLETRGGPKVGNAAGTGVPLSLNVLGKGGLPASGVGAVALNVTVTEAENPSVGGGYVTVFPCGTRPNASNINFVAGQTVANSVIAPVSATGDICFYVYGTAQLLADVSGYFPTG
jgi:hypothetical protein